MEVFRVAIVLGLVLGTCLMISSGLYDLIKHKGEAHNMRTMTVGAGILLASTIAMWIYTLVNGING